jgi:hypothetical protein
MLCISLGSYEQRLGIGIKQSDRMALSTFRRHQAALAAPDKDPSRSSALRRV